MGGDDAPDTPKAPNPSKSYEQGVQIYLKYLPEIMAAEQTARDKYDPQRVASQQALQTKFGPTQYSQQLAALNQLDPTGTALRKQLGGMISSDLSSGYGLPQGYETELMNQYRGAQAARGNDLGRSAGSGEASFLGKAALDLYQQKLQNAGNFLSGPSPVQQALAVQPVMADRAAAYSNPNAGYAGQSFAMGNYSNLLAQQAASGAGQNPWATAIGGAATGATLGSAFGPYGAIIGGLAGGAYGYFG